MLQRIIDGIKERPGPLRRPPRTPVYMKDAYVALLLRHYRECGLPEPDWIDEIPDSPRAPERTHPDPEPVIEFSDSIVVTLTPNEGAGQVHLRTSAAMVDLYNTHYSRGVQPTVEELVRAYNAMGYSEKYLLKLLSRHDATKARIQRVDLDKIFKPDTGSKKRAKKKETVNVVEEEEEEEDDDDEEEDDDDQAEEEDPFDMEVDVDEEEAMADEEDYESE
jgi:hypothetical protein